MQRDGATLHYGVRSYCSVFSCCGAPALGAQVSVVVARVGSEIMSDFFKKISVYFLCFLQWVCMYYLGQSQKLELRPKGQFW